MTPTHRRVLLVVLLAALLIAASAVPIEQSVSGPCRLESAETWYVERNGAGQITTGWERSLLGSRLEGRMLQFERPDVVELQLAPGVRQGTVLAPGDTVMWIYSHEGSGRLRDRESERAEALSRLDALQAGAREIDVESAEHDFERASAELEYARAEYDRIAAMHDSGFASPAERDLAESALRTRAAEADLAASTIIALRTGSRREDVAIGEAEVRRLDSAVRVARNLLGERDAITCPLKGRVELGGATDDALLRVARLDTVAVLVRLPESSIPAIDSVAELVIELDADPAGPRTTRILEITFITTPQEAGAYAIGLIPNHEETLRIGMSGRASCSLGKRSLLSGVRARMGRINF